MNIQVLGSSSKGNGYIINTDSGSLIIECGMKFKIAENALNFDIHNVQGVLVSHEHGDHAAYLNDYARYFKVYATEGTLRQKGLINAYNTEIIRYMQPFSIGDFRIVAFKTVHDAEEPCGYLIRLPNGEKLAFATDTRVLNVDIKDVSYWMVECNYERAILVGNVNSGVINISLANRIISSHLSLDQLKKTIMLNDMTKTKMIMLIHLSDKNSNADKFISEISQLTGKLTIYAKKGQIIELL